MPPFDVPRSLDADAARRWCQVGLAALRRHQREIDELNVYPVPDGDTGTNLVLTFSSAERALVAGFDIVDEPEPEESTRLGRVLRCMARGALLGARGNSGVIMSQLLRGMADALGQLPEAGGRALASALAIAADAGYQAIAKPVEGTVLSVARGAADAAAEVDTDDLVEVVQAAAKGAASALSLTPQQLPVLAAAGVVDAGGRGLVVVLEALVEVISGIAPASAHLAGAANDPRPLSTARETGSEAFAYEVQYLLDATADAVSGLKSELEPLGDSLVVVGAGAAEIDVWNVHVHVNDVGAAIEAGVRAGRPHRISVTRFDDQIAAQRRPVMSQPPVIVDRDPNARAVVVVASGSGLAGIFAGEGAVVVDGGPTANPSTADILAAVVRTGAGNVVVLPNDSNCVAVANAAAEEARQGGIRVSVVPTRSPVQALAALAVRDPQRRFEDDVIGMAESAGACRWAEITVAVRDAYTLAGMCRAGDILGLVEGEVNIVGQPPIEQTCRDLIDRLLASGGELVTIITGADAPPDLGPNLLAHLAARWPFVEAHCYQGGQPHYPLLVGVE